MKLENNKMYVMADGNLVLSVSDRRGLRYKGRPVFTGVDDQSVYHEWFEDGVAVRESDRDDCNIVAEYTGQPLAGDLEAAVEDAVEDDGYNVLRAIVAEAVEQSATGKGRERHANGRDWTEQTIFETARAHGVGFQTGQAEKKLREAVGMICRGELDKAVFEMLGAIVYTAAAIHLVREGNAAPS